MSAVRFTTVTSPYKLLPNNLTRHSLVNKTYSNVRPYAIAGETIRNLTALGAVGSFVLGATAAGLTMLSISIANHFCSGENIKEKNELKPAYNEIEQRAKNIKAIRESKVK